MITTQDVVEKWIPYRLQAISTFLKIWKIANESPDQRKVEIVIDGKTRMQGNVALIANPMIEAGLIHARALLGFLGLSVDRQGRLVQATPSRQDDIAIEKVMIEGIPLRRVTPEEAIRAYSGPPEEAEAALVAILEFTNKSVAHLTTGALSRSYTEDHLEIACRGITELLRGHLYEKLGMMIPDSPLAGS
ncbi:hypothetical protein [Massilia sp. KIM]|uniref:hypothetical protein n=1 Tax=Massilia sp. KIM TaxID=1955422 RepID=UPI00117F2C70|nr:hypothetical protein [Massilia sp. KIM]